MCEYNDNYDEKQLKTFIFLNIITKKQQIIKHFISKLQ